jgi:hypothetical protein
MRGRGNERRTLLFTVDSSQPALGSQIDLGDPVCLRGTSSVQQDSRGPPGANGCRRYYGCSTAVYRAYGRSYVFILLGTLPWYR